MKAKQKQHQKHKRKKSEGLNIGSIRKAAAFGLAAASKINSYVGEYTENTVVASRRGVAIAYGGFALGATVNPVMALVGAAMFTADKVIDYNIKVGKENLSADFMKQLSGGTFKTRG